MKNINCSIDHFIFVISLYSFSNKNKFNCVHLSSMWIRLYSAFKINWALAVIVI